MSNIEIFEASTDAEREQIYRFCYQVFTLEQHKYSASADHKNQMLKDALDEVATHICVAVDGRLVGCMRQIRGTRHIAKSVAKNFSLERFFDFDLEQFGFTGRLLILPQYRSSNILIPLLSGTYESARKAGVTFDFINCNPHLVRLYESIGYLRYRSSFFHQELGLQVPMVIVGEDQMHLEKIRSPFAPLSARYPASREKAKWLDMAFPERHRIITSLSMLDNECMKLLIYKTRSGHSALLKDLSEAELRDFIQSSTHMFLEADTRVVRRGDMGQELFLILGGTAEVRCQIEDGSSTRLARLGQGDVFGEISVITSKPRSADVIATTALEVIFIDQITLRRYIKGKPDVAAKLLYRLSGIIAERLEAATRHVVEESTEATTSDV